MFQYTGLLRDVLANGTNDSNRTNTPARRVFGRQIRFDLARGFPLLTLKRVPFKLVLSELLWFIQGRTDLAFLHAHDNHIWDEWATPDGSLGPVYGKQWRSWYAGAQTEQTVPGMVVHQRQRTIDQLAEAISLIQNKPTSRRIIVSAWNPADLPDESKSPQQNVIDGKMALAPCHTMFQFAVIGGKLHCQLYQRSADLFLGVPFNIASYALLTHMVAHVCDLEAGEFIHTFGDAHIYLNHLSQVEELLDRENIAAGNKTPPLPIINLNPYVTKIDKFGMDDVELIGYKPFGTIKADVAI